MPNQHHHNFSLGNCCFDGLAGFQSGQFSIGLKWIKAGNLRASLMQQVRQWTGRIGGSGDDPGFWKGIAQKLPPWVDELGALLLTVTVLGLLLPLGAILLTRIAGLRSA